MRAVTTNLSSVDSEVGKALVIPKWQQVDLEEMRSLENNGTWQLVDSPRGKKPVDYKWLYTINGSTKRYKLQKASHKPMGLTTKRHLHRL